MVYGDAKCCFLDVVLGEQRTADACYMTPEQGSEHGEV